MNKKVIGSAVLLVLVAAFAAWALRAPSTARLHPPELSGNLYTEQTPVYDIVANYANSTPLSTAADKAAIVSMHRFLGDTIAAFKAAAPATAQKRKETLLIRYLISSSPHTVSYIYTIYEDTEGVHGNTRFKTFTFDTATGKELTLSDIFKGESDYLEALSRISRAKLPEVIGPTADAVFIEKGTTPDTKNFENFFIDNADIVFLFDTYQVASFADGPQTLRLPLSTFSSILKPIY